MRVKLAELKRIIRQKLIHSLTEGAEEDLDMAGDLAATPEYKNTDAFVQFLMDEDRLEFTHVDLRALGLNLRQPLAAIRAELESYGLKLANRQPEKRVRGFTTSSNDRWYGPGSLKTHGGAGIDPKTGKA